jgi:hypothetical protein
MLGAINLVWQHVLYQNPDTNLAALFDGSNADSTSSTYAFKALGAEWARTGKGPKWLAPQVIGDDDFSYIANYADALCQDPTIERIKTLLTATSAIEIEDLGHPLVLDLYRPGPRIVLPVEIANSKWAKAHRFKFGI